MMEFTDELLERIRRMPWSEYLEFLDSLSAAELGELMRHWREREFHVDDDRLRRNSQLKS